MRLLPPLSTLESLRHRMYETGAPTRNPNFGTSFLLPDTTALLLRSFGPSSMGEIACMRALGRNMGLPWVSACIRD